MMDKIAFENGQISNFEGLVTLNLDRVILHSIVHHSSMSTYKPNFSEIEERFCGRRDELHTYATHVRTHAHFILALLGRLCQRLDLTKLKQGLVTSYDLWPGNRMGLFLRKVSKYGSK